MQGVQGDIQEVRRHFPGPGGFPQRRVDIGLLHAGKLPVEMDAFQGDIDCVARRLEACGAVRQNEILGG